MELCDPEDVEARSREGFVKLKEKVIRAKSVKLTRTIGRLVCHPFMGFSEGAMLHLALPKPTLKPTCQVALFKRSRPKEDLQTTTLQVL